MLLLSWFYILRDTHCTLIVNSICLTWWLVVFLVISYVRISALSQTSFPVFLSIPIANTFDGSFANKTFCWERGGTEGLRTEGLSAKILFSHPHSPLSWNVTDGPTYESWVDRQIVGSFVQGWKFELGHSPWLELQIVHTLSEKIRPWR